MMALPYREEAGGILLHVRLTPRGGRDAIEGFVASADGKVSLAARVRAVPENGAANDALIALLADALAIRKNAVEIVSGHASRQKAIRLGGDPHSLAAALRRFGGA